MVFWLIRVVHEILVTSKDSFIPYFIINDAVLVQITVIFALFWYIMQMNMWKKMMIVFHLYRTNNLLSMHIYTYLNNEIVTRWTAEYVWLIYPIWIIGSYKQNYQKELFWSINWFETRSMPILVYIHILHVHCDIRLRVWKCHSTDKKCDFIV